MQRYTLSQAVSNPMSRYKARRKSQHREALQNYEILGYIAAGTYGRVYKAKSKDESARLCAIKKFKADKEGEVSYYTGISQSAYREMALCKELNHENVINLVETILEDKSIYLVFDYAEHDLLQLIHYHYHPEGRPIPNTTIKSIMYQLFQGVDYLHKNWILHRDLKPANIMITAQGVVKIGDLGLARIFRRPLQSLLRSDKIVVTIWYRAPELLLGGRHYTPAIDLWAIGCIFAEMLSLRPIFKSEEVKMDNKKVVPFQKDQFQKMIEILGSPSQDQWPNIVCYPDYPLLQTMRSYPNRLKTWYKRVTTAEPQGLDLLQRLLSYNPHVRVTAEAALAHAYFNSGGHPPSKNAFEGSKYTYPPRRLTCDTNIKAQQPAKRSGTDLKGSRKRARN